MLAHLGLCIEMHGCLQDDLLYETLTVYETLYYAAMLRLPSSMTTEQKMDRVNHVIHTLGLDKCKDTIVGRHILTVVLCLVTVLYTQNNRPEGGCTRIERHAGMPLGCCCNASDPWTDGKSAMIE